MDEQAIPLREMIATLRDELEAAEVDGANSALSFDVEKIELELKVALSRKNKGDAKVAFWVISAGGGMERGGESTHTFKLTLTPISRGKRLKVHSESVKPPEER